MNLAEVSLDGLQETTQNAAAGVLDTVKEAVKPNVLVQKFHEWKGTLLEIGVYFGIGFLVGFLFKKYLKYILLLILFIVSLVIMQQFDLIEMSVNWPKIQELFNIQPATTAFDPSLLDTYVQWIKANFIIVLSASIGFIVGLKVG